MINLSVDSPVVVHDGVEPVGDGGDGARAECRADGVLDQSVRFHVIPRSGVLRIEIKGPSCFWNHRSYLVLF